MHLKFLVLKEDGGPNFNPAGKFFTEDGDMMSMVLLPWVFQ